MHISWCSLGLTEDYLCCNIVNKMKTLVFVLVAVSVFLFSGFTLSVMGKSIKVEMVFLEDLTGELNSHS